MDNTKNNILKWRFDVSTFRLIGRELITDRITALFELVKNCYDANAQNVYVEFYNVGNKNVNSKIIIRDDGLGMALSDIKDKWMVVGTASKRKELYSPAPYNRRYVGEKGIGRFAVDKLGKKILIKTKKENESETLNVNINWDIYETLEKQSQLALFTDVENSFHYTVSEKPNEHGTSIEISQVNEIWSIKDIQKLYRELTKMTSPYFPPNPPFNIYVSSDENKEEFDRKKVITDVVNYASHSFLIGFDNNKQEQETLIFDSKKGKIGKQNVPYKSFGPIKMHLHYFNTGARAKYNSVYKDADSKIDGFKIYRDGLITTPFAEFEDNQDKKRDILGIDKKLWHGIFDKISTREIIGIIEITKENNPQIIDATNRQDFVENKEYNDLKDFIIQQLNVFADVKKHERAERKKQIEDKLKTASENTSDFIVELDKIAKENPQIKPQIEQVKKKATTIKQSVDEGIKEKKKEEQEQIRRENIYWSLMSLQEYAAHVAHAVRTSLGKIKRKSEFFKNRYPDSKFENYFKQYAIDIYSEMERLNKAIDFMLSYAGTDIEFEDVDFKNLIFNLFNEYAYRFQQDTVILQINIERSCLINYNRKFIEDIFENLIDNSLKALRTNTDDRIIKCSSEIDDNRIVIYFSDNGYGIPDDEKDKVFDIFYTTTASQGGAGLGLYIVKTRVEALKGEIEIVESEFQSCGATFKITFPFKKQ
jgi:signal transduction histidine kinase